MSEFLNMGGYGAYVWPTYVLAAVVMVVLVKVTLHNLRRSEKTLDGLQQARRQKRGAGRDVTPEHQGPMQEEAPRDS